MKIYVSTQDLQRALRGDVELVNTRGQLKEVQSAEGGVLLRFDDPAVPDIRSQIQQASFIERRAWQRVAELTEKPESFVVCKRHNNLAVAKWSREDQHWITPSGYILDFQPTHCSSIL